MKLADISTELLTMERATLEAMKRELKETMDKEFQIVGRNQILFFIATIVILAIGAMFLLAGSMVYGFLVIIFGLLVKIYRDVRCVRGLLLVNHNQGAFINCTTAEIAKDILERIDNVTVENQKQHDK
ncbi:MAG: hypothetical protein V3V96_07725 [Acidiferrobacterales bacterium]